MNAHIPSDHQTAPRRRHAFITGAGKGIGRALARALAAEGWTVVASARSAGDLQGLAAEVAAAGLSGTIIPLPLDVTDALAVAAAADRIERDVGALELAVLNAGTHTPITAREFDVEGIRRLIETNLMGTVHCLAALMPHFLARKGGQIAVVASVAGYVGLPSAAGYGATKAALINMCEALKPELDRSGVSLTLINPGFVDTPLTRKNGFPMPFLISTDDAAKAILRGLRSGRFEVAFPWRMRIAMRLLAALPYRLLFALTRRMVG